jgi:hypothetical protein
MYSKFLPLTLNIIHPELKITIDSVEDCDLNVLLFYPKSTLTLDKHDSFLESCIDKVNKLTSDGKKAHKIRWVIICTVQSLYKLKNNLGVVSNSRVCPGICSGTETNLVGVVGGGYGPEVFSVDKDVEIGKTQFYDSRIRNCRIDQYFCRDCTMMRKYCITSV